MACLSLQNALLEFTRPPVCEKVYLLVRTMLQPQIGASTFTSARRRVGPPNSESGLWRPRGKACANEPVTFRAICSRGCCADF